MSTKSTPKAQENRHRSYMTRQKRQQHASDAPNNIHGMPKEPKNE